jgi:uncharacterized membrane protein
MIARLFSPHGRIFLAAFFGGVVYTMLPETLRWSMRALAAWDCGALLYIVLAAAVMRDGTSEEMRRRAELYDEPQLSFVVLTLLAVAASFAAIFVEFSAAKTAPQPLIPIALGAFTLLVSWVLTHLMFTMHYAHLHYGTGLAAGGIVRPEKGNLNYTDLLYFSFLIGCATETSDFVSVNSAMRRFMIVHSVVAYLFNVVIIALTISVISSFI